MDAGAVGAIIGASIIGLVAVGACVYDRCVHRPPEQIMVTNPLLKKHSTFKVKNLFSHMEI